MGVCRPATAGSLGTFTRGFVLNHSPPHTDANIGAPQLSERLTAVVGVLRDDIDSLVRRVVTAVQSGISDYYNLNESSEQDLIRSVRFHLEVWFDALLTGTPLSPAILDQFAALGRRRVHQDVSLAGLLRAFRIGSREAWRAMLDAVRQDQELWEELLFSVSPYFLYHFDVVAQLIGGAYQAEQHLRRRWRDRLRYELCTIIFTHPENMQEFTGHARALGIDLSAEHAALALRLTEPANESAEFDEKLDPFFVVVSRLLGTSRDSLLYMTRHGDVLVWSGLPRGEAFLANELKLVTRAKALAAADLKIAAIGIGLPARAHQDWKRTAEQALKALDVGTRLNPKCRVHRYSDVVLDNAALGSEDAVWFFDAIIREFSAEAGLLETLNAYLELGMHRKATAGRLEIHTNTLDYRLSRIESILGAPLSDLSVLAKLNTALRLRRINSGGT
jgi:carbohydrate diacid regulator